MEEMGMSDLQFKAFLKQLVRRIEEAKEGETKQDLVGKLDEIVKDLKGDIES